MPLDVCVERIERDRILAFRAREFSGDSGGGAFGGDLAATTRHWAATVDGVVVGCVSALRLRGHALRGMAVAPEFRRQGVGAQLLRAVHAEVEAPMWCNARIASVPFYESMGWIAVGPTFEMGSRGTHQRMTVSAWCGSRTAHRGCG